MKTYTIPDNYRVTAGSRVSPDDFAKLAMVAKWACEAEAGRRQAVQSLKIAQESRRALDSALFDSRSAQVRAEAAARAADNRETVAIAELIEAKAHLSRAVLKNTRQAAKIASLRARLATRRERRRAAIDRALVKETASASLIPVVHGRGGIDCSSEAFKSVYSNRAEAIENGIPGYILRTGKGARRGEALDALADSLQADGYFQCPEDRHCSEYLLELLRNRTPSAVFQSETPYVLQAERNQLDCEEQYDDSFNPAEFEAIPL